MNIIKRLKRAAWLSFETFVDAIMERGFGVYSYPPTCAQETFAEFMAAPEGIVRDPMLAKTPSAMNDPSERLLRLTAARPRSEKCVPDEFYAWQPLPPAL